MMLPPQHSQQQRHSTGSSMAPKILVSFLGQLLEQASSHIGDYSPRTESERPSFVLVTDNARVHTKLTCSCKYQLVNLPRASSCPSDLNTMLCCIQGRCGNNIGNGEVSLTKILRVASTGSLCLSSNRWDANNINGFVDDGTTKQQKKSDAAARPPMRSWNMDSSEDHSDSVRSPSFHVDDDDKDDFGSFVILGDEDEDGNDEDHVPNYLGISTKSLDPTPVGLKSVTVASSPSFSAFHAPNISSLVLQT